jgi:HK97 family phage portal protein
MWRFVERFLERRALERWRLSSLESWADTGMGAGPTAAGVEVTPERAIGAPAVYACVSVLAQDVARTPIKLRRRVSGDTFEDARDHGLFEILHALPNAETTAYSFKQQMMRDLLTYERAYAEIVRVDGRVVALWRLDPTRVLVDRDDQRRKRWRATLADGRTQIWTFDPSTPPIFELAHPSPIRHCRELIGTALALQAYVGKFFSNGARLGGVLQTDSTLNDEIIKRLRATFEERQAGLTNAHRVAVLEAGLKWQAITAPNSDAQLNETLLSVNTQIAGAFRVPTWKIGDLTKANYSNMESGENSYVNGTLDPYFVAWEHAIRRDLLTTRQYGQFDVAFDRSTLIRNDIKSLHEALARGRDAGFYSVNDVRKALGLNPISAADGGDRYLVNGNMIPVTAAGNPEAA